MRTLLMLTMVVTAALAMVPDGVAQYTFQAAGVATLGDETFRMGLTRHPNANGFPVYGLGISSREPTPSNPFGTEFVENTFFYVVDNWNTSPTATVSTHYFAIPSDPNIDFALEGSQLRHTVTATGHYNGYEFVVSGDFGI